MGLKRCGCKGGLWMPKTLASEIQLQENQLWQKNQMAETDQLKIENRMLGLVGVLRLFSLSLKGQWQLLLVSNTASLEFAGWSATPHHWNLQCHFQFYLYRWISSTMSPVAGQQNIRLHNLNLTCPSANGGRFCKKLRQRLIRLEIAANAECQKGFLPYGEGLAFRASGHPSWWPQCPRNFLVPWFSDKRELGTSMRFFGTNQIRTWHYHFPLDPCMVY